MADLNNKQESAVGGNTQPQGQSNPAPASGSGTPPSSGGSPPTQGNAENKSATGGNVSNPAPASGDKKDNPPASSSGEKKRVKCAALKGKAITIGKDIVQADENGVIEVDATQFERLLSIPGYEEA